MGSRRLPGKVLKKLGDRTLIEVLVGRLTKAKTLDGIVVVTTREKADDRLVKLLQVRGIAFYRGSAEDVLSRFAFAAKRAGAEAVVRITGDCPLVDGQIVDAVVTEYRKGGADYVSNVNPPTFPDGLDVEVFSSRVLERAHRICRDRAEREHVTPWMRNNPRLKKRNVQQAADLSRERWTVDEPQDLEVVEKIFRHFAPDRESGKSPGGRTKTLETGQTGDPGWEHVVVQKGRDVFAGPVARVLSKGPGMFRVGFGREKVCRSLHDGDRNQHPGLRPSGGGCCCVPSRSARKHVHPQLPRGGFFG